jgi:4-amino-4-deoxy-L-arabinose transferase-like glycosyltransferase
VNPAFPGQARNLFVAVREFAPAPLGLRLARYFSFVLGLCTLLAVYGAAMLISRGDRSVALTATGLQAFIPQYTFLSGYVTNDNLAVLLSALSLLIFLHLLRTPDRRQTRLLVVAGALLAMALYTKLSLLFLLPLGLLCLLLRFTHHRSARRWLSESAMLAAMAVAPFLLGLVLLPGLREQVAYAYESLEVKAEFISLRYLVDLWPQTYTSFWGTFGWMNVSTPRWIADSLTFVSAVGLFGAAALFTGSLRQRKHGSTCWRPLLLLWVTCGLVATGFIRFNLTVRQPQGRLLFAALPALVILVTIGYRRLSGRLFPLVGTAIVLFAFAVNLLCLFGSLLPAYAFPH